MPTCTIVFGTSQHFWTAISQHATLLKQWSILKVNISPAAALEQLAPEPFVHLSWIGPRQGRRHGRSQRASHCGVQFTACLSLKRLHMRWNLGPASFVRMAPGVARARAHTHLHSGRGRADDETPTCRASRDRSSDGSRADYVVWPAQQAVLAAATPDRLSTRGPEKPRGRRLRFAAIAGRPLCIASRAGRAARTAGPCNIKPIRSL